MQINSFDACWCCDWNAGRLCELTFDSFADFETSFLLRLIAGIYCFFRAPIFAELLGLSHELQGGLVGVFIVLSLSIP